MQVVPGRNIASLPTSDAQYGNPDPVGQSLLTLVPQGPAQILVVQNTSDKATIDFQGYVVNPTGTETWDWNWVDGSPHTTTQDASHKFTTPAGSIGNYTVKLTVSPGARTCTVTIKIDLSPPVGTPPIDPVNVIGTPVVAVPTTPNSDVLAATYCYYMEQAKGLYLMLITAPWRKNPRDGVWYKPYDIGTIPLDPTTGEPDLGMDASGTPYPPEYWDTQQPSARNRV